MKEGKKRVSILGSTGSIGRNALKIMAESSQSFDVVGLAAGKNLNLLAGQVAKYKPGFVSVEERKGASKLFDLLKKRMPRRAIPQICWGEEGAVKLATLSGVDLVLSAIVGSAALKPTYRAIKSGKRVALANKESVVMAGRLLMEEASRSGATIIPVDSEHSAIFQSMLGHNRDDIKRLILTASGGPFLRKKQAYLKKIHLAEALNHPNWKMGVKITVDSATLVNKALEIIEARWLFDISPEKISVMIHPQSVVHSIVEYKDGSMISQMGIPDMRVPISYALVYPERLPIKQSRLSLEKIDKLTFLKPRGNQFPALKLAYKALSKGDSACVVLNAANEASVKAFVCGKIRFLDIPRIITRLVNGHRGRVVSSVDEALNIHNRYILKTEEMIKSL